MFNAALIFAALFLLVGPIRLIVPYAKLVAGFDAASKRKSRSWLALFACSSLWSARG